MDFYMQRSAMPNGYGLFCALGVGSRHDQVFDDLVRWCRPGKVGDWLRKPWSSGKIQRCLKAEV